MEKMINLEKYGQKPQTNLKIVKIDLQLPKKRVMKKKKRTKKGSVEEIRNRNTSNEDVRRKKPSFFIQNRISPKKMYGTYAYPSPREE